MNKEQLVTILQVTIFSFDGGTENEILEYNVYDPKLVKVGIKLCSYLNSIKIK